MTPLADAFASAVSGTGTLTASCVVRRHHHSPTSAMQPAGQDPEARLAPGTVTVPLCSRANASHFWIMLLLVCGRLDHGMIQLRAEDSSSSAPLVIGTLQARSEFSRFC